MTSATFEDIHLAQILEIVRDGYAQDTLFLIDLDAVGIPYDTDTPNPPTVPDTGLPAYQYRTDGMIEYANMKNNTMLQVLTAIGVRLGLQFVSEPGFIWISTPDLIAQESTWEPESRFDEYENEDRLLEKTKLVAEDIHLADLLEILSESYDINIVWDYRIIEQPDLPEILPISYYPAETMTDGRIPYINIKRIQLRDALKATLRPLGLSYIIQRNHIWISTPQRIESEIDHSRQFSSQQIIEDHEALEEKLHRLMGIVFEDIYVTDLFDVMTSNYEIDFAIDQNIVTPDGYTDKDYARYYGPAQSIPPCKTCTPISNGMIRHINLSKLRLGELLDIIARQLNLDYRTGDGKVIFSTPERIRASDLRQKSLISAADFLEHLE